LQRNGNYTGQLVDRVKGDFNNISRLHPKQPGYMVEETDHKYIVNYRVIKVFLQVPMKQEEDSHEKLVSND
jgi:hypothetical protein